MALGVPRQLQNVMDNNTKLEVSSYQASSLVAFLLVSIENTEIKTPRKQTEIDNLSWNKQEKDDTFSMSRGPSLHMIRHGKLVENV